MKSLFKLETILNFNYLISFSFEDVIQKKVEVIEGSIEFTDSVLFTKPLWSTLKIKSEKWSGTLALNFNQEFLKDLIDKEDIDLGLDALGEILNTIAGVMAEQVDIIEVFGEFIQEPPLNSKTPIYLPTADIVSGKAKFKEHKISFAFVITPNE